MSNAKTPVITYLGRDFHFHDINAYMPVREKPGLPTPHLVLIEDINTGKYSVLRTMDLYQTLRNLRTGKMGFCTAYQEKYPTPKARLENARVWHGATTRTLVSYDKSELEMELASLGLLIDEKRQAALCKKKIAMERRHAARNV